MEWALRLGPAFIGGRFKSLSMVNKARIESQNGTNARLVNVLTVGVRMFLRQSLEVSGWCVSQS